MRRSGPAAAACALLVLALAGCGTDSDDATAQVPAASSTEEIEDDAKWVGTTRSGATITAEAPADDDHPLVAQAEEYREAADAAEVFYVVVVYDNSEGTDTIDVFGGGRVVTEDGEDVAVPHFAAAGGVFEGQINEYLPRTVQDEAYAWYADFYDHQAVGPGSVDEVILGTTSEVPNVAELYVSLDEEGGEARLEPVS